jgi:hypothetical protein
LGLRRTVLRAGVRHVSSVRFEGVRACRLSSGITSAGAQGSNWFLILVFEYANVLV